jgi:hypothetical protein
MSNSKIPPHEQTGGTRIPFDRLNADQIRLIHQCGTRVAGFVNDWRRLQGNQNDKVLEHDLMLIRMDIACAALSRDLDLFAWLMSDDLSFFDEWVIVQKTIERGCGRIPGDVPLRFAQTGARLGIIIH